MKVVIPAGIYFFTWAIVGRVLWAYGFTALEQTDLSDSVPPVVLSFFKYSVLFFIVHSFFYSIVFPLMIRKCTVIHVSLVLASNIGISFITSYKSFPPWERLVCNVFISLASLFYSRFISVPNKDIRWEVLHIVYTDNDTEINGPFLEDMDDVHYEAYFCLNFPRLLPHILHKYSFPKFVPNAILRNLYLFGLPFYCVPDSKPDLSLPLVSMVSILTSAFWTVVSRYEGAVKTKVERKIHSSLRNSKKRVALVKFTVRMLGMILFQYFFKLTSWVHVKAFLCITVSWLVILVLLCVSDDLGFFDFLLENMVVGCTVSQYALGRDTWIAYAAAFALYGLRLLAESVPLEDKQGLKVIPLQMQPNSFLGKLFVRLIRNKRSKEEESAQKRRCFVENKMQRRESVDDIVENGTQENKSIDIVENKAQEGESSEVVIDIEMPERESVEEETRERMSVEIVEYDTQERENGEIVEVVECDIGERKSGDVAVDNGNNPVEDNCKWCQFIFLVSTIFVGTFWY